MRQINMTVYRFDELSESAKSRAWMDYAEKTGRFFYGL